MRRLIAVSQGVRVLRLEVFALSFSALAAARRQFLGHGHHFRFLAFALHVKCLRMVVFGEHRRIDGKMP